ncbi:MAG: hypothetical protein AB1405_10470 [Bdellovibrionota bacterium]
MSAQPLRGRQSFLFRGVALDDQAHPLSGMVRVFSGEQAKFTRRFEGTFAFELAPGNYRTEVAVEGFVSQQYKFLVRGGGGTTHNFVMRLSGRSQQAADAAAEPATETGVVTEGEAEVLEEEPAPSAADPSKKPEEP